jgi:hypothetical protein
LQYWEGSPVSLLSLLHPLLSFHPVVAGSKADILFSLDIPFPQVTFVCRNRSGTQVYFSITFEIVELEEGEETGTGVKPAPRELTPNAGQKEGGMPGGFGDEEETPDEID